MRWPPPSRSGRRGRAGHRGAEIDAGNRAPRALAFGGVEADHHGRPAEGLLEAGGDDADDAGMPAVAGGPDQRAVDAAGRRLGLGGGEDRRPRCRGARR